MKISRPHPPMPPVNVSEKSAPHNVLNLKPSASLSTTLGNAVAEMTKAWKAAEGRVSRESKKLPAEMRALVDVQVSVHKLHLQSELLSKGADAISQTVKRVQQLGSGG